MPHIDASEPAPGRRRRIIAGILVVIPVAAIALGIFLFFSHATSNGSDCGTVLAPQDPMDNPLAGCPGSRLVHSLGTVVCGVVAVGCGVIATILIRRERRATRSPGSGTDPSGAQR